MTNRYVCSTLEEMRKALDIHKEAISELDMLTLSVGHRHLSSLVEEAQTFVNRMEAALHDWGDYESMLKRKRELKKEIRMLKEEKGEILRVAGEGIDVSPLSELSFNRTRFDD